MTTSTPNSRLDNLTAALTEVADSTGAPEITSLVEGTAKSATIASNPRHAARLAAGAISELCSTDEYCRLSLLLDPAAAAYGMYL